MKIISRVLAGIFVASLLCASAFAQTGLTGAIVGRAQDAGGALIPGVEVTISSPSEIGGAKTTVTDEQGVFRFELLSPGTYRVTFALPGFKTLNIDGIDLVAGMTRTVPGNMEVSATSEEITVTSQAPTIDLEAATTGFNWSQKMIEDLPWSRSLEGISEMIPGARISSFDVGNSQFGTSSTVTSSVGGNNVVIIDGLIWCQTYEDYGSFEEMNITTSMKGADQIGSGITVNMAVKSGGNAFHGNFSGSYDNGSMSTSNVTAQLLSEGLTPGTTTVTHFSDVYGDLGGPILKNKFWFYVAYRAGVQGSHVPGFIEYVGGPTALFKTTLRDPTAKLSYQINSKMKFDATWGLGDKWQPYRGASGLTPSEATEDQNSWSTQGPVGKFTDIIDSKTTATFQVSRGGYWWPAYAYPMPTSNTLVLGYCGSVGVTPTAACPATGQSFQPIPTVVQATSSDYAGSSPTGPVGVRVSDSVSGATDGGYLANYTRPIRWQIDANFSRILTIAGKANEFKAGYFYWWDKSETSNFGYPNDETYSYKSLSTESCPGTIICSTYFMHPNSATILDYPNISQSAENYKGFFLNDKLTVSRRLTVNIGWRFEHAGDHEPAQGNNGSRWFPTANGIPSITQWTNPSCSLPLFVATGDANVTNCGTTAVFPTFSIWSPRLAFTYDLFGNGKIALKGGYGRYEAIDSGPGDEVPGQGPFNPVASRSCTYNLWNGIIPFVPNPGPDGIIGTADDPNLAGACSGGTSTAIRQYAPNLNAGYQDQWLAGIDVGLSRNYSIRFNITRNFVVPSQKTINPLEPYSSYTAESCAHDPGRDGILSIADGGPAINKYTGLANTSSDDDPHGPVCTTTVPTTNTLFALSNSYYVNYDRANHEDESANTYFNLTFNKNYANKWSFVADFGAQYSRATAAYSLTPDAAMYNPVGMFPTWNENFKMNGTYSLPALPLFIGHKSLAGFQYSSSFVSQSGSWYGRSASVVNARNSTVSQGVEGQVGRYPWIGDWDQRISKKFKIGDRMSFEAKWDLYNSLNASTITSWKSTSTASSSYLQPNGTPLQPGGIFPQRIYEWSGSFKF